jgi:hypothetical protein
MRIWCSKIGIVLVLHFNPWVEASAGGLLVPEGLYSSVLWHWGLSRGLCWWSVSPRGCKYSGPNVINLLSILKKILNSNIRVYEWDSWEFSKSIQGCYKGWRYSQLPHSLMQIFDLRISLRILKSFMTVGPGVCLKIRMENLTVKKKLNCIWNSF